MQEHDLTASLMESGKSEMWLGPGRLVLGYVVGQNDGLYNVAVPVQSPSDAPPSAWNAPGDVEEMRSAVADFCPTVRTLLGLVNECSK